MAKELLSLKSKLQKADLDVRNYIQELEKRNTKLHLQMVKLEADKKERDNRIKALQKQPVKTNVKIHVQIPWRNMPDRELVKELAPLASRLIQIGPELGLKIERM